MVTFLVIRLMILETYSRIKEAIEGAEIYIAPGFICQDGEGTVCTLGRGGSDFSAALYAADDDGKLENQSECWMSGNVVILLEKDDNEANVTLADLTAAF